MNIVITGGAGFIGSHFVRKLREYKRRITIIVVDRLTYAGDIRRIEDVPGIDFLRVDICDYRRLSRVFARWKVRYIVNFAAQTHVDRSIKDDTPFIDTNIKGTHNLLRITKEFKIKMFYHISTDEVYGDIEEKAKHRYFSENSPLRPNSPYAASKASADLLIRSYRKTYGLPSVIIRPSNNYGPWQHREKFIPTVICNAFLNKSVPIYARGKNRREWLYVEDCVEAILRIVLSDTHNWAIYNIGSRVRPQNIDVARRILKIMNKPRSLIKYVQDRPGHDFMYALSCNRLEREFGWKPRVSLNDGLKKTVEWYIAHREWWDSVEGND
ncbi:MAG: dTDP-glucose 4,6-dehydratase [Candidatus Latescibacterota bacterium]|nr:MAG: dTDP-glucose 4,6-dehydratase [Candidatus Latescibacterota bacterium]